MDPASTGSATAVTYRLSSLSRHSTALLMSRGSTQGTGIALNRVNGLAARRPGDENDLACHPVTHGLLPPSLRPRVSESRTSAAGGMEVGGEDQHRHR